MATVVNTITQYAEGGLYGDTGVNSYLSFQGSNLPPIYLRCEINFTLILGNDNNIYLGITSGNLSQSSCTGTNFPIYVAAKKIMDQHWIATPSKPADAISFWEGHVTRTDPGPATPIHWSFPAISVPSIGSTIDTSSFKNLGSVSSFPYKDIEVSPGVIERYGFLEVAGTTTYSVTAQNYPESETLTFYEFSRLLDFFPNAIYKSSHWKSCNRSGGSWQSRSGTSWIDKKNKVDASTSGSNLYYRSGSNWVRTPKIGEES